ncbi:MAG TPA: hypothetical protein VN442_19885 [Bryobacteraceae bacterium]|nr:hypothetical protein [Bryobacteraceae bacterium]
MSKGKRRRVRETEVLRKTAVHVRYELDMLRYATTLLTPVTASPLSWPSSPQVSMAMECFLLHYRNLRAFLCPSIHVARENDAIASDFLGSETELDFGDTASFKADKERLDQMLAHVSYNRDVYIERGDFNWRVADLTAAILDGFDQFLATPIPPTMQGWFPSRQEIERYRAEGSQRFAGLFPIHGLPTGPGPRKD